VHCIGNAEAAVSILKTPQLRWRFGLTDIFDGARQLQIDSMLKLSR